MLWRHKLRIFIFNFLIDLNFIDEIGSGFDFDTSAAAALTFLKEGGMPTPGGTEKQRPRRS